MLLSWLLPRHHVSKLLPKIFEDERVIRKGKNILIRTLLPNLKIIVLGNRIHSPTHNKITIIFQQCDISTMHGIFAPMIDLSHLINQPRLLVKCTLQLLLVAESLANPHLALILGDHFSKIVLWPNEVNFDGRCVCFGWVFLALLLQVSQKTGETFLALFVLADQFVEFLQAQHLHYALQ